MTPISATGCGGMTPSVVPLYEGGGGMTNVWYQNCAVINIVQVFLVLIKGMISRQTLCWK